MTHDDSAPGDESNEQAPPMPEKESGATLDSVPGSQPDPALDLDPSSDSDPRPEPEPLPPPELEPTSDTDQTPNGGPVGGKRWFVNMLDPFQRRVLPRLIAP